MRKLLAAILTLSFLFGPMILPSAAATNTPAPTRTKPPTKTATATRTLRPTRTPTATRTATYTKTITPTPTITRTRRPVTPAPRVVKPAATQPPAAQPPAAKPGYDSNGDGKVTCADFQTQAQAQEAYNAGYTKLDGSDKDGKACESLP